MKRKPFIHECRKHVDGERNLSKTLEELMKEIGCCDMCDGCFECDCPKNLKNGPKLLQVDIAKVDYDLNLASGA
jgi:hypothetical protein